MKNHFTLIELMSDVIEPLQSLYQDALKQRMLSLHCHSSRTHTRMKADRALLMCAMQNLIQYALIYGQPNSKILVNVLDRGYETELNVWMLTDESRRESGQIASDTALLNTTRQVINMHGGRFWMDEQSGSGIRFLFTLPERQFAACSAGR